MRTARVAAQMLDESGMTSWPRSPTLRPTARDGQQERRVFECPDILGMARSEEEDLPLADLGFFVTHTVVEASLKTLEGHGRSGVMGAHLDALGDHGEGEPERPRFDQSPADAAAADIALVPAELADLLAQIEGEVVSGESTGDGRHGDLRIGEAMSGGVNVLEFAVLVHFIEYCRRFLASLLCIRGPRRERAPCGEGTG